jgi:toxin HigB-1
MDIFQVTIPQKVLEALKYKAPKQVALKLHAWVESVGVNGLYETRKISSYHDEPVKGKERRGQRSIRLNKSWRAFYKIDITGSVHFVEIIEVNKHEY